MRHRDVASLNVHVVFICCWKCWMSHCCKLSQVYMEKPSQIVVTSHNLNTPRNGAIQQVSDLWPSHFQMYHDVPSTAAVSEAFSLGRSMAKPRFLWPTLGEQMLAAAPFVRFDHGIGLSLPFLPQCALSSDIVYMSGDIYDHYSKKNDDAMPTFYTDSTLCNLQRAGAVG